MLCLGVLVLLACSTATESRDQPSRVGSLNQVRPTLPPRPVAKVTHVIEAPSRDQPSRVGSFNQIPPTLPARPVIKVTHVIETIYYSVNGVTTTEIFKSLKANSINPEAISLGGDTFTAGMAESEPLLTYYLEEDGACILSSATLAVNSTVTLPRHGNTAGLSSRQSDRWLLFAAAVALHEQTHVDILLATMKDFVEVAPNSAPNCDQLASEIDNSFDRFLEIEDARQEEFHADEIVKSNAARAPLRSEIANGKAEMARLDTKIDAGTLEMARLDTEIDARSTQITILATEITRIEQLHSISGVPAGIYDEYKRALNLHNALVEESNALVISYNALVEESKGLMISYNALVEKGNRIVEELNWAP